MTDDIREIILKRPHRHTTVVVIVSAPDEREAREMLRELGHVATRLEWRLESGLMAAGAEFSCRVQVIEDPKATTNSYVEALERWVDGSGPGPAHLPEPPSPADVDTAIHLRAAKILIRDILDATPGGLLAAADWLKVNPAPEGTRAPAAPHVWTHYRRTTSSLAGCGYRHAEKAVGPLHGLHAVDCPRCLQWLGSLDHRMTPAGLACGMVYSESTCFTTSLIASDVSCPGCQAALQKRNRA